MKNKTHGGTRERAGRKASPFPEQLKKFRASEDEWAEFLSMLPDDAREAFTLVFNAVKKFLKK